MRHRPRLPLTASAALAVLVAGCGRRPSASPEPLATTAPATTRATPDAERPAATSERALSDTPELPVPEGKEGFALRAFSQVMTEGCAVDVPGEGTYVWSPVVAEVLAAAPRASRGQRLATPGLDAFFRADGAGWYAAERDTVQLPPGAEQCASELERHARMLRRAWKVPPAVEALILASPPAVEALYDFGRTLSHAPPPVPTVEQRGDAWHIEAPFQDCDQVPSGLDCGGLYLRCSQSEGCTGGLAG